MKRRLVSFCVVSALLANACGDSSDGPVVLAVTDEDCRALPPEECQLSSLFLFYKTGFWPADDAERDGFACQLTQGFLYNPEEDCVDERTVSEPVCQLDVFSGTYSIYRGPDGRLWEFGPPMKTPPVEGWTFHALPDSVRPDRLAIYPNPRCAQYGVPLR